MARGGGAGEAEKTRTAAGADKTGKAESARALARLGHARFERALREILAEESVSPEDVDVELAWIYEVSGRR
jgi:predicted ATPase